MEEKKAVKISLSIFFLIISIIIIIVMGLSIYKLYNEKITEINKSTELQEQVNSLNETVSQLQENNNKISENNDFDNSLQDRIIARANVTEFVNRDDLIGQVTYKVDKPATNFYRDEFEVILEDSKVYFELKDKAKVERYQITQYDIKRLENEREEITGFNGKVKNVYIYEVGQTIKADSSAILFLMDDGKIEYISIADALQTTNLRSRGEILGINDITEIYSADASFKVDETGGPGWKSCIVKDSNNNYYTLETLFKANLINLETVYDLN